MQWIVILFGKVISAIIALDCLSWLFHNFLWVWWHSWMPQLFVFATVPGLGCGYQYYMATICDSISLMPCPCPHFNFRTKQGHSNKANQTSGILLFMGIQKFYGLEISQFLSCMLQFLNNSWCLFIFIIIIIILLLSLCLSRFSW